MKKLIFCLILGFTAGIVFGQATVPAVVVSTFSTRGQAVNADDAESITELFVAELGKQSGVRVVDRTSLDRVVAEMRFQASDWSNSQKTAQLGRALNAEFLVRGQINQLGDQVSVAITALDIKTLEVVSSSTQSIPISTLYNAEKSWGSYKYYNIFRTIENTAYSISQDIDKRQNWFVGRWRSVAGEKICILEFKLDGTIIVERYDWEFNIYNVGTGNGSARGTGTYNVTSDGIDEIWNINISLIGIPDTKKFPNIIEYRGRSRWQDSTKNVFRFGGIITVSGGVPIRPTWEANGWSFGYGLKISNGSPSSAHYYYNEFSRIR